MKVQRVGGFYGPVHVFGDEAFAKPVAGPFASEAAARCWVVEQVEKGLSPAKLAVWQEIARHLPAPTDFGIELAVIGLVAHGRPAEAIVKYIPREQRDRRELLDRRTEADHRMAAAGERP